MPITEPVQRVLLELFDAQAIRFGAFRLKLHEHDPEAPLSPVYVDLRGIRSSPWLLRNVSAILGRVVVALDPDFVADVPTAATPMTSVLAAAFDIPMISPRLALKEHGIAARVEGTLSPGSRVVVVDDLITNASSKVAVIEVLRDAGFVVTDVVVLLDREQGGTAQLRECGCALHASVTLTELLDLYVAHDRVRTDTRSKVLAYLKGEQPS